jgi:NADH-quinone oxidoreductase subunit D
MHTNLHRPYSFDFSVLTLQFLTELSRLGVRAARSIAGAFLSLTNNRSFKIRLSLLGQLSQSKIQDYGLTGVIARSGGVLIDLRRQPYAAYSSYSKLNLRTFLGTRGDNYDRFVIRIKESVELFRTLSQILSLLVKPRHSIVQKNVILSTRRISSP